MRVAIVGLGIAVKEVVVAKRLDAAAQDESTTPRDFFSHACQHRAAMHGLGPLKTVPRRTGVFISVVIYIILLGHLAAGDLEIAPVLSGSVTNVGRIPKTVISTKLRVVFFAGLEGTGHHFIVEVFRNFYAANKNLATPALCKSQSNIFLPNSMRSSAQHYNHSRKQIEDDMRMIASVEEEVDYPGTVLTVQKTSREQMKTCPKRRHISYPSGSGPKKVMQLADVVTLVEVAEAEGVDIRIIYLHRSAEEILLSTTVKRNFQSSLGGDIKGHGNAESQFMAYVQVLLLDLAALHSSLEELGPGFVMCHRYSDLNDETQASGISNFICPTEPLADSLRSTFLEFASKPNASSIKLPYEGVSLVVDRLQRKLDVMEKQFCAS